MRALSRDRGSIWQKKNGLITPPFWISFERIVWFCTKCPGASWFCPYKSPILWRQFFDWREIGARILCGPWVELAQSLEKWCARNTWKSRLLIAYSVFLIGVSSVKKLSMPAIICWLSSTAWFSHMFSSTWSSESNASSALLLLLFFLV